jgi:hypothetical protein
MATVAAWEQLDITREVAVAVELLDPVTQQRVSQGLKVTLGGRADSPYISPTRRFVWLGNAAAPWPATISVDPGKLPFAPIANQPLAAAPANWPHVDPEARRIRVTLTPTALYPYEEGVTAITGYLYRKIPPNGTKQGISGAEVWFQWAAGASWFPGTPPRVKTDARGEFGLFARIPQVTGQDLDVLRGLLKVRVFVKNGALTKSTSASFRFIDPPLLSITPPYPPVSDGRVVNGAALVSGVALDWNAL